MDCTLIRGGGADILCFTAWLMDYEKNASVLLPRVFLASRPPSPGLLVITPEQSEYWLFSMQCCGGLRLASSSLIEGMVDQLTLVV